MGLFDPQYETLVWTDAAHAELARRICKLVEGVTVLALGGPSKPDLLALGERLHAGAVGDDLRQLLIDHRPAYVLLMTPQGVKRDDLALALDSGADVITLDPPGGRVTEPPLPKNKGQTDRPGRLALAPLLRLSPGWLSAADPQTALGEMRSFAAVSVAPAGVSSLFARLHDAMDLVTSLLGPPSTIYASLSATGGPTSEDLRDLSGHMSVHLSYSEKTAGIIQVSDQASVWSRRLTLIGEDGQLMLSDTQYRLFSKGGQALDDALGEPAPGDPAELIAYQFRRMIDHAGPLSDAGPVGSPQQLGRILACCHAALLSSRTRQAEDVGRFLRMQGI